jgi:hypothetical protein
MCAFAPGIVLKVFVFLGKIGKNFNQQKIIPTKCFSVSHFIMDSNLH